MQAAPKRYSRAYLNWALFLLVLGYTSNFIDRTILSVLQQPIKEELHLTDAQLGILGGFAFAILYSTLGIPIARLAERHSRRDIIAASMVVWSAMTALCATATGYGSLFAYRVGVGVGEAGASPAAHSMIADYFPPQRRATALAIYSLGIPIGVMVGSTLGGVIAQHYGWRPAFLVVGLPGLLVALLTRLTLHEPPRGNTEGGAAAAADRPPSLGDVVRRLTSRPAFVHIAAGTCLASFAGYGIGAFTAPYFIRNFGLNLAQAGFVLAAISGGGAAVGTFAGGFITDRAARADQRWYVWTPAIGLAIAAPLYVIGYQIPHWPLAVAVLCVPPMLHYTYLGPSFGVMHNMVTPRMRATATALLFLVVNLIGLGLGPTLVGLASDSFAGHHFALLGQVQAMADACPGGRGRPGAAPGLLAACHAASAYGVRAAILTCTGVYVWAALHYWRAAKFIRADLAA